jgi:lipopolysaccharide transport system ATP-binding protein
MASEIAIQAEQLGKRYQIYKAPVDRLKQALWRGRRQYFTEFWALKHVDFAIRKGETVGIIGRNGSGKSTLLQMICGVLQPTEGRLVANGRIAALLELGAGFNPEFSGRDNVFMNAAILGLSRKQIEDCYEEIVRFADIGEFIERPVKTYSSGMYVRLAFATAIHVSPDILLVDEALSVGDIRFQQKCIARIKAFCESGTVVFVSHDLSSITELCSRAIWIDHGAVVMDGSPKRVSEQYAQYMYEGKIESPKLLAHDPRPTEAGSESDSEAAFVPVNNRAREFGNYDVRIIKWRMLSDGRFNGVIHSGKPCEIGVMIESDRGIGHPIVGFLVKDRKGRIIMGDSNALVGKTLPSLLGGSRYRISFSMASWPNLCEDDYTLTIAVADGSLENHVQCHWLHDVHTFRSIPVKTPAGIFSVLETEISLDRIDGGSNGTVPAKAKDSHFSC